MAQYPASTDAPNDGAEQTKNGDKAANRRNPAEVKVPLSPAQRSARARRRLNGAKSRISTHEDRRDYYREVIHRREIVKISPSGERLVIRLSESEVDDYRAKRLMEEALLLQAKHDRDEYQHECDTLLGMTTSNLRQSLKNARATEYARRMGPRTAEATLNAIKGDPAFPMLRRTALGERKGFRSALWNLVVKVNPDLKEEFEGKPKLFTRVVEILHDQLKPEKKEPAAESSSEEEHPLPVDKDDKDAQEGATTK
jgi:hypothetical protein